jgi:hypothetical protein
MANGKKDKMTNHDLQNTTRYTDSDYIHTHYGEGIYRSMILNYYLMFVLKLV